MNCAPLSSLLRRPLANSPTRHDLAANPAFVAGLQQVARHVMALHDRHPRVCRLVSAQQKWLLTQSVYALHLERVPGDPLSGITATRLLDIIAECGAASRNTATAFLAELLAYRLLRDTPDSPNKRSRPLEPTDISDDMMLGWFLGHLHGLDRTDGGGRHVAARENDNIFRLAQPRAAKRLIADAAWRDPPESVGNFVWTQSGALVLDDLIARIDSTVPANGRLNLGEVRLSEISEHYRVSLTHMRRVFARAEKQGLLGWHEPGRKGGLWMSEEFLRDYVGWQAVKFEALAEACDWAILQTLRPVDRPARMTSHSATVSSLPR